MTAGSIASEFFLLESLLKIGSGVEHWASSSNQWDVFESEAEEVNDPLVIRGQLVWILDRFRTQIQPIEPINPEWIIKLPNR